MGFTADVLLTLLAAVFFGACWLYIRACDAIIGPDDETHLAPAADGSGAESEAVAP